MMIPFLITWLVLGILAAVYIYFLVREKPIIGKHRNYIICDDLVSGGTLTDEQLKKLVNYIEEKQTQAGWVDVLSKCFRDGRMLSGPKIKKGEYCEQIPFVEKLALADLKRLHQYVEWLIYQKEE